MRVRPLSPCRGERVPRTDKSIRGTFRERWASRVLGVLLSARASSIGGRDAGHGGHVQSEQPVQLVEPWVDIDGRSGYPRRVTCQDPPQCRCQTHRRAQIASCGMGEMLLLSWHADVGEGRVDLRGDAGGPPAESASADEHHPVVVLRLDPRPPLVIVLAGHRRHREVRLGGEINERAHTRKLRPGSDSQRKDLQDGTPRGGQAA